MEDTEGVDIGAQMQAALVELYERGEVAVIEADGEPVTVLEWRAPGVAPGEDDELVAEALGALGRRPEDRGPEGSGPR